MSNDQELASPLSIYVAKLERRSMLDPEDRNALLSLPACIRQVDAHELIVEQGQEADHSFFLVDGLISRQRQAHRTGQIISICFPGDAVDLQTLFFHKTDHALFAHVPTTVAAVSHAALIELCDSRPLLSRILWHDTLVDSAIFREWAMNIGHRRAHDRIGYLLLEFEARLGVIGQAQGGVFQLALTQQDLASALGLSLVHMNKSLRRLREADLASIHGREVRILDKKRLREAVGFNGDYLHLSDPPAFQKTQRA